MDEGRGWLRTHWRTAVALALIFGIALFLRFYFVYGLAFPDGLYSGGSDSYYWDRALRYSYDTGKDLGWDSMLNYPIGLPNPRPPLFPWFSLLAGRILAPLFADPWQAIVWVFLASTGLFGALTVFPTYLLAKEAFGRRAGLVAAFLLGVSAAHLQRSQATDADHDAFTLFFVVATFYFYLKALKALRTRRWVENWSSRASIATGVRSFFREERRSLLYGALAGLSITVIALSWQGWAYVPVILLVYFAVQLFLDRVRNQDTLGISILFATVLATPLVLALPWYASRGQIRVWFDVPGYLFLVAIVLGAAFTVTRDYPWTLVIPSTLVAGGVGLGIGVLVNPALAQAFVSGAGYFVQTKVYETIAEAQAPGLSQLILSFGWFTFYFSLAAVVYMVWQIPRRRDPAYTMIVVWAFASIFMAMAAARFIFNASPAFAVTAAYAIDALIVRADFAGMRRSYRSLAEGSWRNALRKSVKVRHVLAVFGLALLVLLPNVWFGVDAAIPYELKPQYDQQVHDLLPAFLQSPRYDQLTAGRNTFYFGAFGYSLPQPDEYFPAAWSWFQNQDADRPPAERPAFLSWWDYGFEAVDRGQHPTVADNFQNGFAFAGQFITAQSEDQAVGLLTLRLLEGDVRSHRGALSSEARAVLEGFGLNADEFVRAYTRPADFVPLIVNNPQVYGAWDAEMQPFNAMYIYLTKVLTDRFDGNRLTDLYRAVRRATGTEIGYFVVDARLFPISATNTGIFYAPVKLSDHRILELPDGRSLPTEFFQILVTTSRGSNIPLQAVQPDEQIQSQTIEYQPMFYNSMFYRAYVGYSPKDLGVDDKGIPGFSQALQTSSPIPAWNLTHFRVAYRTAYYNPFVDAANHTDAWQAMDFTEAQHLQTEIQAGRATGVVDLSTQASITNGLVFLRYYDGAWVNGTVTAGGSTPLPGVRITVTDELGTPHGTTLTDANGRYSVLVPFGDISLTASVGTQDVRALRGSRTLSAVTFPVSLAQAMREEVDADGDGRFDWIMERNIDIPGRSFRGSVFFDLNRDGAFGSTDRIAPGATVELRHTEFPLARTFTADRDAGFSLGPLPDGTYTVQVTFAGHTVNASNLDLSSSTGARKDFAVPFTQIAGFARTADGAPVEGVSVELRDETNGTLWRAATAADGSFAFQPVLAGSVSLIADRGDFVSQPFRLQVVGANLFQNLTMEPGGRLSGATRLFGTAQPHATLEFQLTSAVHIVRTVTSDDQGAFQVTLSAGDWNVNGRLHSGGRLYATLGRVTVLAGGSATYAATFVDGVRVNGTIRDPAAPQGQDPRAQITFMGSGADWWIRTGAGGAFLAFVPAGTYGLQALSPSSVFQGTLTFASDQTLTLTLTAATAVSATVYWDLDGSGNPSPEEGIAGARVSLTDPLGQRLLGVTNGTGIFLLLADKNRTYSGLVERRGFASRTVPVSSADELKSRFPMALTPLQVDVTGTLRLGGAPLQGRETVVQAIARTAGARSAQATTDLNGEYRLSLLPGGYELVVDENVSGSRDVRYQNLGTNQVLVTAGDPRTGADIEIVVRLRVTGTATLNGTPTDAAVSIDGPDVREIQTGSEGFEIYLQEGDYTVRAETHVGLEAYAFLETMSITVPESLSLTLERATPVSGFLRYAGQDFTNGAPVRFERQDGAVVQIESDEEGRYAATLVAGTYAILVDFPTSVTESGIVRFYRYFLDQNLTVSPGTPGIILNLELSRELANTTVSGLVTLSGAPVDASLSFLPRSGGALEGSAASSPSGQFVVALAPGTYDVYASRAVGSSAFLGTVLVPHADTFDLNVALVPGFFLSGVTTDPQGIRTTATVAIQAIAKLEVSTDAAGAYRVLLPVGSYTITASRVSSEQGTPVEYRASASLDLASDTVVNFRLEKVVQRSVFLSWDNSQKLTIAAGGSVTYTIEVHNTGNVADTFVLSGTRSRWTYSFAPSSVALGFGTASNSHASVSVTIGSPPDALVDPGPLPLRAISNTDGQTQGTVNVEVGILRYRGVEILANATLGTFDGRFANYTFDVRNGGNAAETVTVVVANPDDVLASGWIPRLAKPGETPSGIRVGGLSVAANSTGKVTLQLQSVGGTSGIVVVLELTTADTPVLSDSVVYTVLLPDLTAPGGIGASGPNIVRTPSLNLTLVAIVVSVAGAVVLAFVLTRRRR